MLKQTPQLEMILKTKDFLIKESKLNNTLELVQVQDVESWLSIINESFGFNFDKSDFIKEMGVIITGDSSQLIFIKDYNDGLIATGSIIILNNIAELHYIAVKEKYRGMNLGYIISNQLILNAIKLGVDLIVLHTDDFRIAAIKTYLKLGFTPNLVDSNQGLRWIKIIKQNNLNWN